MPPAVIVLHCVLVRLVSCVWYGVCCVLCVDAAFIVTFSHTNMFATS